MPPETTTKFGICGGQFTPDILMSAIEELIAGRGCCVDEFVVKRFEE
jgi:tryptophan synthase beta subunit